MSNLAVSYAAVILADADLEVTADKLLTLVKAANIAEVEPIYAQLFAQALAKQDVKALLTAFSASAGAGPVAGGAVAAAAGGAAAAPAEEEAPAKEEEESDEDMGMGLFD